MSNFSSKPRRLVAGFLVLLCLASPSLAYSFAVFSDNHQNKEVLGRLIGKLNADSTLAFAVNLGDFTNYGRADEYALYKKRSAALRAPVYHVIGNHDAMNGGWKIFEKYFGPRYYAFEREGDRFIALDDSLPGSFDSEQFAWLKAELAKPARHKFVMMHKPVFDPSELYKSHVMSGRAVTEELIGLFAKYKVDYVLAGHIHGYARSERGKVTYIVSAGAGGPLYLPPEFGGFYNYVIITVEPDRITDRVSSIYD